MFNVLYIYIMFIYIYLLGSENGTMIFWNQMGFLVDAMGIGYQNPMDSSMFLGKCVEF